MENRLGIRERGRKISLKICFYSSELWHVSKEELFSKQHYQSLFSNADVGVLNLNVK